MSDITSEALLASDKSIENYLAAVALCLLIYDTVLAIPDEIDYIWKQPFRLNTLLYYSARFGLFGELTLFFVIDATPSQCAPLNLVLNVAILMYLFGTQGLSLARVYAIAPDKKLIMALLIIFLVLNQLLQATVTVLAWSCTEASSSSKANNYLSEVLSPLLLIYAKFLSQSQDISLNIIFMLFEAGVLYVTVSSLWNEYNNISSKSKTNRLSLGALFLRQSVLQFVTIFLLGMEQTIGLNISIIRPIEGSEFNIEHVLTTIIVCRLLLELRRSHQSSISRFDTLSNMGNCIIGELGDTERSWTRVGQDLELLQVDAQAAETEPRLD